MSENTETVVVDQPSSVEVLKEAALKAAATAVVMVVVTQAATWAVNKMKLKITAKTISETIDPEKES